MTITRIYMQRSVKNQESIGIGFLGGERLSKAKRNEKKTANSIRTITDTVSYARITEKSIRRTTLPRKGKNLCHGRNNIKRIFNCESRIDISRGVHFSKAYARSCMANISSFEQINELST